MFHSWKTKCLCKWFCLCEWCAFAERLVCAKRVYFWYVSFNYQQSKSEKRQPSPNNLFQRSCPSDQSPVPQCDLSCFMTGHKGTEPFYLNSLRENRLLDADFQQPLPSTENIHSQYFTLNAKFEPLYTLYLIPVWCIFTAIYITLQKNAREEESTSY